MKEAHLAGVVPNLNTFGAPCMHSIGSLLSANRIAHDNSPLIKGGEETFSSCFVVKLYRKTGEVVGKLSQRRDRGSGQAVEVQRW